MLIDELIEKAFSDGYEYALMEQREYAYPGGMVGTGVSSSGLLAKKSLAPRSPKAAEMWAKVRKSPIISKKVEESASRVAKAGKVPVDPMAAERAKVSVSSPRISRPAPYPRQAQRAASNPLSRASQFLSGPGGMR